MNPLLRNLALLLCSACGASEGSPSPATAPATAPAPTPNNDGPILKFEKLAQDFGRVSDTAVVNTSFGFTNTGKGTLKILEVKASCGCTTTTLPRTEFGPGDGEAIGIEWDMIGTGTQTKTITVRSNATPPVTVLKISAFSVPFVNKRPYMVQFGNALRDRQHRQVVELDCQDPHFTILDVRTTQASLQARVLTPPRHGKAEIEVFLLPTVKWGQYFGQVQVDVEGMQDGERIQHQLEISAAAFAYDGVVLKPTYFTVGRLHPKEAFTYEVLVTSPTGEPFQVTQAEIQNPTIEDLRVEIQPGPDGATKLVLHGDPGDYLGPLQGQVHFKTDLASDPERSVNIMGLVRHD